MKTLLEYFQSPDTHFLENDSLIKAIMKLPEDNRLPIVLHFKDNLSRKQIAKDLGCSVSKVSQKITRGITLLKLQLNPDYFREADNIIEKTAQRLLLR